MRNIILATAIPCLSPPPVFAAKWNQLSGDELRALHEGTAITGNWKGTKYTQHNCGDGRSIQ